MRLLLLNSGPVATLACGDLNKPLTGADMSDTESMVQDGDNGILIDSDIIAKISQSEELADEFGTEDNSTLRVIDCKSKAIIPGFVDSHTHLLWGGDRANEMQLRHNGLSYSDIANAGGGIQKTVQFTRNISNDSLSKLGEKRIKRALDFGTTTIECKSGYGLSVDSELKLLEVNQFLSESTISPS